MDSLSSILNGFVLSNESRVELGLSLLVVLALWILRSLLVRMVEKQTVEPALRYRWRKGTAYFTVGIAIVLIGLIWFEHFQSLSTFLGLLTAGLAIALRDLVASVAGWLFLVFRRPFDVGDRIEIGGHRGDVIDLRLFKFTLNEIGNWVEADQSTGRIVHLPNSLVLSDVIVNYIRGFPFIWNEIPILVTFESDWRRAKDLLTDLLEDHTLAFTRQAEQDLPRASERYLLQFRHLTPIVYTSIADSGVLLTGRHICPPRQRRGVTQTISEAFLDRLAEEPTIELAYPTQRFFRGPESA